MGIDDGAGSREEDGRLMVIGNDQFKAEFAGELGLGNRGDAAIDGDGHAGPGGDCLAEMFGREAVTIAQP